MKKAQTATEYLIILAVVIIIALIVIGVLGGIPGIGSGIRSGADTTYWRTASIGVESIVVKEDGNGSITLKNNFPDNIRVINISLKDGAFNETNRTLGVSGSFTWMLSDSRLEGTPGDTFTYGLEIEYIDPRTNARYIFPPGGDRTISGVVSIAD